MVGYTIEDKRLLKQLQQRVNDLENQNKYLQTLLLGTGVPYVTSIRIWNPDQLAFNLLTASGTVGNEVLNLKV